MPNSKQSHKIIDIIHKHQEEEPNKPFFSFEYFPPKTEKGNK